MKTFTFGIRRTPKGAVAWMRTPSGRNHEKQFRNGYAGAESKAGLWIDEQVAIIRECEGIEGLEPARIVDTRQRKAER